jgi:hypothetical protein
MGQFWEIRHYRKIFLFAKFRVSGYAFERSPEIGRIAV